MIPNFRVVFALILSSILIFTSQLFSGITAVEMQGLSVVGHHFTSGIMTNKRHIYTKDPSTARYLVLKLSAFSNNKGKLFTNDFVLRYFHRDGKEDRTECAAIARAETAKLGDLDRFYTGNGANISIEEGMLYFGLAFIIEKDVEAIEICRIGTAETLKYNISSERFYSVYLTTNSSPLILASAEQVIKDGGYFVVSSQGLDQAEKKVTIHYQDNVESQAREISQRLIAKLGVLPKLKKMDLITEFDIVVWIGKD